MTARYSAKKKNCGTEGAYPSKYPADLDHDWSAKNLGRPSYLAKAEEKAHAKTLPREEVYRAVKEVLLEILLEGKSDETK